MTKKDGKPCNSCGWNEWGNRGECKECARRRTKKWYKENKKRAAKSRRDYYENNIDAKKEYDKQYRAKNISKKQKQDKLYRQTERARALRKLWYHKTKERHKQKYNARANVRYHVKMGHIPPASALSCAYCGQQASEYHHYKGYEKEHYLDVIPLCVPCHREAEKPGIA